MSHGPSAFQNQPKWTKNRFQIDRIYIYIYTYNYIYTPTISTSKTHSHNIAMLLQKSCRLLYEKNLPKCMCNMHIWAADEARKAAELQKNHNQGTSEFPANIQKHFDFVSVCLSGCLGPPPLPAPCLVTWSASFFLFDDVCLRLFFLGPFVFVCLLWFIYAWSVQKKLPLLMLSNCSQCSPFFPLSHCFPCFAKTLLFV